MTTWVLGKPEDFVTLVKRIEKLNPPLKSTAWVKFNAEEKEGGQLTAFGMPQEQAKDMEALECSAFSGIRLLTFRIKKEQLKGGEKSK